MAHANIALFTRRTMEKILKDAATLPVLRQYNGTDVGAVSSDDEEWIALTVLATPRTRRPRGVYHAQPIVQVSCFSRFAERRADKRRDRVDEIADAVRELFEQTDVTIFDIGATGTLKVAVFNIDEVDNVRIPPRHEYDGIAVEFTGTIITT